MSQPARRGADPGHRPKPDHHDDRRATRALVFPDGANRLRADFENSADFTHGAAFSK